jgi:hypothetical protein
MNREAFDGAPLSQKVFKVFESGKELTSRVFLHCHIKLYAIDGFYAEVYYVPAANKIHKVESLSLDEVLEVYGKQLDISGLMTG